MMPSNCLKINQKRNKENTNISNLPNNQIRVNQQILKLKKDIPQILIKPIIQIEKEKIIKSQSQHVQKAMIIENEKICSSYYEKEILKYFLIKDQESKYQKSLQNQKLTAELRTKMIDWMMEVLCSYKCSEQTFFLSVQLMDIFYSNCQKNIELEELHIIGVTCMFIAGKYNEIYPIKLRTFYEKISHFKISMDQIKKKEQQILEKLNYKIDNPTIFEFLQIYSKLLNIEQKTNIFQYQIFQETCSYISKMVVHDYQILNEFKYQELAASIVNLAMKIISYISEQFQYKEKFSELIFISNINLQNLTLISNKLINWIQNYDEKIGKNFQNLKKFSTFNKQNLDILTKL